MIQSPDQELAEWRSASGHQQNEKKEGKTLTVHAYGCVVYKYLTNLVFSVCTVSYGSSFFPPTIYGLRPSRLGHQLKGKKLGP